MSSAGTQARPPLQKILFLVEDSRRRRRSYSWRIWSGGTSFYIKSTYAQFNDMKVSLHGPDPRHRTPWLKFGDESSAPPTEAGFLGRQNLPLSFTGNHISRDVRHVMRFRHDWTMFHADVHTAPDPKRIRKPGTAQGAVCPPPAQMYAVDVDLFLCDGKPSWPDEARARRDNAILGPLQNDSGQFLTGVVFHNLALDTTPECVTASKPGEGDQIIRGLGLGVHKNVLWINEVKLGLSAFTEAIHDEPSANDAQKADS